VPVPILVRSGEFPHVLVDTNYWKSFVHARLATAPGDSSDNMTFRTAFLP